MFGGLESETKRNCAEVLPDGSTHAWESSRAGVSEAGCIAEVQGPIHLST